METKNCEILASEESHAYARKSDNRDYDEKTSYMFYFFVILEASWIFSECFWKHFVSSVKVNVSTLNEI